MLHRLSRVTLSTAIIPEIDGLRFLAIMPVVLMHLCTNYVRVNEGFSEQVLKKTDYFYTLIGKGSMGVNLFFVISGFILALPFATHYFKGVKKSDLGSYYLRRLTRLEPPFIISMIIFFFAWIVLGKYPLGQLLNALWASVLYVHYVVFGKWSIINPISWSLETEVQFYVLAPILFLVFRIPSEKRRMVLVIIICIAVALFIYHNSSILRSFHLGKSLVAYFPFFATGIMIADFYVRAGSFFKENSYRWDLLGVLGLITIYYFHYYYAWYAPLMQCIGFTLVFLVAFKGKFFNAFFTRKEIVVIGGMCYSIYLMHYGALYLLMFFTGSINIGGGFAINYLIQALIIVPIVIAISGVFFVLFERPFMYKEWYKDFPSGYFKRLLL